MTLVTIVYVIGKSDVEHPIRTLPMWYCSKDCELMYPIETMFYFVNFTVFLVYHVFNQVLQNKLQLGKESHSLQ